MFYSRRLRYPGGKPKALTLSYDDNTRHDIRLVEILNQYGIKSTFNLNFGRFPKEPTSGTMSLDEAKTLLADSDHEVAVHGYTHMPLGRVPKNVATQDVVLDLMAGEEAFDRIIRGMAYADGSFNGETGDVLRNCGIAYCRTTHATHGFDLPENWLYLNPTCHHDDPTLFELTEQFLNGQPPKDGWMFYVWGHAYEFNNKQNWDHIEKFCETVAGKDDVWYATNIEIHDYVRDYNRLVLSFDGTKIYNPTATEIFFAIGDRKYPYTYSVKPGETLVIDRNLPDLKG